MSAFTTRPMGHDAGERSFVAKSWVESYSSSAMARLLSTGGTLGSPQAAWRPGEEYWLAWNALVNELLDRARTTVVVDDVGLIAGFIVWEPWDTAVAVHYVYVRLLHRKKGVARSLVDGLPRGPVYYTHRSRGIVKVPEDWRYSIRPLLGMARERQAA